MCDNKSVIAISKNPVDHGKIKYKKIKYHFVGEAKKYSLINLVHYSSEDQFAVVFTKALPKASFEMLRFKISVTSRSLKEC